MSVRDHRIGAEPRWIGDLPQVEGPLGTPVSSSKRAARDRPQVKPGSVNRDTDPPSAALIAHVLQHQRRCGVGKPGCDVKPVTVVRRKSRRGHAHLLASCARCAATETVGVVK